MTKLLGINGRHGSGKDTVFALLQRTLAGRDKLAVRRAFADPLKVSAARALGYEGATDACVEFCDSLKESGRVRAFHTSGLRYVEVSGREFLQRYGDEAHRQIFGTNFWVDALLPLGGDPVAGNHWSNRFDCADVACITDVRFPNEAQRVQDLGGQVVQVYRKEITPPVHASEAPLPANLVNYIMLNTRGFTELEGEVEKALDWLGY